MGLTLPHTQAVTRIILDTVSLLGFPLHTQGFRPLDGAFGCSLVWFIPRVRTGIPSSHLSSFCVVPQHSFTVQCTTLVTLRVESCYSLSFPPKVDYSGYGCVSELDQCIVWMFGSSLNYPILKSFLNAIPQCKQLQNVCEGHVSWVGGLFPFGPLCVTGVWWSRSAGQPEAHGILVKHVDSVAAHLFGRVSHSYVSMP